MMYKVDGESEFKRRPEEPIISDGNGRRLSEIDCYSIDEMDCLEGFFTEVRQACEAQGISADTIVSELGTGQFEINMQHTNDAVLSADHAILFKRLIKGVARRIEHRVAGADANPYLVLAAILGAALHGIETKMLPPEPIKGDAYSLSERYKALPNRWELATEAFKDSAFMREYLGETFVRVFTAVKEQEQEKIYGRISDVEYEAYL